MGLFYLLNASDLPLHLFFLSKIEKKVMINIRKIVYNKYNDYILYIYAIKTSIMHSPFIFEKNQSKY